MAETQQNSMTAETVPEGIPVLFIDVLHHVLEKLPVKDLVNCRLVNKLWCSCATLHLKSRTKTLKLIPNYRNRELLEFAECLASSDANRPVPYGRYHLDFCNKTEESSRALRNILGKITTEKCHKLKIFHTVRPEGSVHTMNAALNRQGVMSFANLENLEYIIKFYENFDPENLNMSEVLQQSEGIRIFNVFLSSYLGREGQTPIMAKIFTAITSPLNNFRLLTTLGIEYSYLNAEQLQILAQWDQPLKNLALGTFDLKPDKKYPFPGEALHEVLRRRSATLKSLRIKVDKEFPWEELSERFENGFAYDDHFAPPAVVVRGRPISFKFPAMKNLESLEIMAANMLEIDWAWRLNENSFPQHFPKLKKFRFIQFQYSCIKSEPIAADFLPDLRKPSLTVEEVCLPDARMDCNYVLMHHVLNLFPNIRVLDMRYNRDTLEMAFSSMPTLEKLILHLGEELVPLDQLLTGVPDLPANLSHDEALVYDIESRRVAPSISMLKNLQELYLTTEDYYVRISDVTAYQVLLKMEKFCKLTAMAYPWEETTMWRLSPQCMKDMESRIQLTLKVFSLSQREKFFSFT